MRSYSQPKGLRLPSGAPGFVPPCIRQRFFPLTAGIGTPVPSGSAPCSAEPMQDVLAAPAKNHPLFKTRYSKNPGTTKEAIQKYSIVLGIPMCNRIPSSEACLLPPPVMPGQSLYWSKFSDLMLFHSLLKFLMAFSAASIDLAEKCDDMIPTIVIPTKIVIRDKFAIFLISSDVQSVPFSMKTLTIDDALIAYVAKINECN
jgi:hypothetical protein